MLDGEEVEAQTPHVNGDELGEHSLFSHPHYGGVGLHEESTTLKMNVDDDVDQVGQWILGGPLEPCAHVHIHAAPPFAMHSVETFEHRHLGFGLHAHHFHNP